jgi:hypothetical protein
MSVINKLVTTTALATFFLASMPEVHARIASDETNETLPKKILRIRLKTNEDGSQEIVSSRFLEPGELDLDKVVQSSSQTQEEWNPTEEELNRILDATDEEEAAKANSTKEEKKPSPNMEENIFLLLNTVSQNLPKAAEILKNEDKEEIKSDFTSLGKTLLNTNYDLLGSIIGSDAVNDWSRSLNKSERRGAEKQTNQGLFGMNKKNHYVAAAAYKDPNNLFIKIAATNPEAWDVLMSKQDRFPGLLERMKLAKAEVQTKK